MALTRLPLGARLNSTPPPAPIVLIGGVTGSGKGHLAKALGRKLGIARVLSTDTVREVLRSALPRHETPALHHSSFLAGGALCSHAGRRRARLVSGFEQQAALLLPALSAVIARHQHEGEGLMLEGVHLTPDVLVKLRAPGIVPLVVVVRSRDEHRQRFAKRADTTGGRRAAQHYLHHFGLIRLLQEHVLLRSMALGLPVVAEDEPGALQHALQIVREALPLRATMPPPGAPRWHQECADDPARSPCAPG